MLAYLQHSHNLIPELPWETDVKKSTGLSLDQMRFAVSFIAAVSAGVVLRWIRWPKLRQLFSFIVGFGLLYYPFGSGIMHAIPTSLLTYLVMWLIPKKCGTLSWLINFPYLLALHVANASGLSWNDGDLDFTGAQMVLTLKLISTAMCYQDYNSKTAEEMTPYQRAHCIRAMPSLLEYFSYVFAFGNLLAGPVIEYRDYQDFINNKGLWDPKAAKPVPAWGCYKRGFQAMFKGIVTCAIYLSMEKEYGYKLVYTDWYHAQNVFVRMAAMQVIGTVYRARYYFAWALGEASLCFAGLDFLGWQDPDQQQQHHGKKQDSATESESEGAAGQCTTNGKQKLVALWGRCNNAKPLKVEFCDAGRLLGHVWNISTGVFLRRYVYERLTPPGRKPTFRTLMATQLVSGVWHGLYPGYFMFFAGSAVLFAGSSVIYVWEKVLPAWIYNSWPWWAMKVYITKQCLDFLAVAFLILTFKESWAAWGSVYYIPLIYMVTLLMIGRFFPGPKKKAKGAKGEDKQDVVALEARAKQS